MKHLKYLFLFISLAIFASCSESDVEGGIIADDNQAIFSGGIGTLQTRVTGNSWDNGDAIGIFALKADQALSDAAIFDGKSNVKYTTTGDGAFTSITPINFIDEGNLDFVSYYPFQAAITEYKYNIDVTAQTDLAAIDLLYSNNAKGQNATNPNVNLDFKHMLSKLILNIELGNNLTSLQGLTASISNIVVNGNLALANGVVTTGTTKATITPHLTITGDNDMATVTAIVVPGQNLKDVQIVFNLGADRYVWTPTAQELASSMKYEYKLKLNIDGSDPIVLPVKVGATISDWADGYIGDEYIDLDPEGEPSIATNVESLIFEKEGGNQQITITANVDWTAASDADWLTIDVASGTDNGVIIGTATANDGVERNANITITDGTITKTVTVIQNSGVVGGNDGTKEKPYTVAEAIANQDNGAEVWVKAFIVGWKPGTGEVSFSNEGTAAQIKTNIVIADSKDENAINKTVGVQLSTGGAREALNLSANPGMYKAEVLLQGFLEKYFGDDPGLKGVLVYEVVTPGETLFASDKSDISFTAATELTAAIQLTTLEGQAWTATSGASWLTVAPAAGTSSGSISVTAQVNVAATERTATVTITPVANPLMSPIVINITQLGAGVIPNNGTKELPYTVQEVKDNQGKKGVWVKAFIVGSNEGSKMVFGTSPASGTNIIIADNKDTNDESEAVNVALPAGAGRDGLNLVANPGKYKVQVLLKGDLEAYFGGPGMKNVKEFE